MGLNLQLDELQLVEDASTHYHPEDIGGLEGEVARELKVFTTGIQRFDSYFIRAINNGYITPDGAARELVKNYLEQVTEIN